MDARRRFYPTTLGIRWRHRAGLGGSLWTERPEAQTDSQQPQRGKLGLLLLPFSSFSVAITRREKVAQLRTERYLHTLRGISHSGAMGTVSELCVTSLQTFLCPAVKALQQEPGRVIHVVLLLLGKH